MVYDKFNDVSDKREYIRLDTVFPVEFQLVNREDRNPLSELREGFTKNIGKGGMSIFTRTLKEHEKDFFSFIPHQTKIRLIINVPLNMEPIESFATIEWIEKQSGPIVDTYLFGVSYDFINELEYEKIVSYAKWLYWKPRLVTAVIGVLSIAFIFSAFFLFRIHAGKVENERKLLETVVENKRAKVAEIIADKKRARAEAALETAEKRKKIMQSAIELLVAERNTLKGESQTSEDAREELKLQIEGLAEEKALLEEQVEKKLTLTETAGETAISEEKTTETIGKISPELLKAERENYKKFRELILNGKVQSLSAYVSTHRSSIYHAAGLFALAELRYKRAEWALASVNYKQIIARYPQSKYALYSSHRLTQLGKNQNYDFYILKDFYDNYDLPKLFDYRKIEPYVR